MHGPSCVQATLHVREGLLKSSDQDWTRLFGVYCGTTRQWGNSAESLVRRDKRGDMPLALEIEGNSQLQRIKRPKTLTHSVLNRNFLAL